MQNPVTELAIQAKTDKAHMWPLWLAVERLVAFWANRYRTDEGTRLFEHADLMQGGFLALVDAVCGFDPDMCDFTPYFRFHVRRHFREISGHRTKKIHPETLAGSLDAPIGEDGDASMLDLLPDPEAHLAYEDAEERIDRQRAAIAILAEADRLDTQQREAFTLTALEGRTLKDAACIMAVSPERVRQIRDAAIRRIRNSRPGRKLAREFYPVRHVTLAEYKRTFTSEVEDAVLLLERLEQPRERHG